MNPLLLQEEAPLPQAFDASMSLASFEVSMSFDFENPSTEQNALIGTSWTATSMDLGGEIAQPITIEFDSGNHVHGSTGCNRYGGAVELSDTTLTFGDHFQATRRYCHGLMGQERAYLNFLKGTTFVYDVTNAGANGNDKDELVLYSSGPGPQGGDATRGEMLARFVQDVEVNV